MLAVQIWSETADWKSQTLGEVGWSGKEDGFNMKRTEGRVARRQRKIRVIGKSVQVGFSGQSVYAIN